MIQTLLSHFFNSNIQYSFFLSHVFSFSAVMCFVCCATHAQLGKLKPQHRLYNDVWCDRAVHLPWKMVLWFNWINHTTPPSCKLLTVICNLCCVLQWLSWWGMWLWCHQTCKSMVWSLLWSLVILMMTRNFWQTFK